MPRILKTAIRICAVVLILALLVWLFVYSQRLYFKNAYPIKFEKYVEKYSEQYELDPHFVYAVIRTESDFTETATSSVGARGLMQVTEATFDWIKNRLKDKERTFDSMYEGEKAVQYGCYLLSYLKETLGSEQNVLCGYHAGVNRAKDWLSDDEISKNGQIIYENIPYPDTKQYVDKVMKTYRMYQKLYR